MVNINEKIERINEVNRIISDLKQFNEVINVFREAPRETKSMIKVKIEKSFSILGSRYYGLGTVESEIKVPATLIKELVILNKNQIDQYENELKTLLGE